MGWKLKRVKQCEKCPWRVDVDLHDIPDGYSEARHHALRITISEGLASLDSNHVMSCHEHGPDEETHCIGWLVNQIGSGNNIRLRLKMMDCENASAIKLVGKQHKNFEDTLPSKMSLK